MAKRKPTKVVERPKTRKELRKDKRTQKKANRVHFHKRKKELKIEYRERLKQQKKDAKKKGAKPKHRASDEESADEALAADDDIYDQADMSSGQDSDEPNDYDDDESIASDFTLSDAEMEQKFAGRKNPKKAKAPPSEHDHFLADLQKEKQKQRKLEKEMRKQRVKQLRAANEDEDKMIRKLEKQLKIDKKRSEKHVPTMFNDGLEYALELCLPENIQKMYTAAKEAADNEANDSDAGFEEDLALAMGETAAKTKKRKLAEVAADGKGAPTTKKKQATDAAEAAAAARSALKMAKLRQAESKYFGSDDELDSDLSGNDSEYEHEDGEGEGSSDDQVLEVHNAHKKKKQAKGKKEEEEEFSDDFGLQDDENDFEDDESDDDDDEEDFSDDDDEAPEEVHKPKKTKQATSKTAGGKKPVVEEDSEDADFDDESDTESDYESEPEPPKNNKKPAKPATAKKQPAAVKKPAEPDSDDFGDGDDDFDEDVFGLSSGDEDVEPVAKKPTKSDVWEDIYGRTRDKDGNVVTVSNCFYIYIHKI